MTRSSYNGTCFEKENFGEWRDEPDQKSLVSIVPSQTALRFGVAFCQRIAPPNWSKPQQVMKRKWLRDQMYRLLAKFLG